MKKLAFTLLATGALIGAPASADTVSVEVTNLTHGTYFTPLLITAHRRDIHMFRPGTPASAHLQAMAEGGDISGLETDLMAVGADTVSNPAAGMLAPGASTSATMHTHPHNRRLSLVAMLLPSNDGFVGGDSLSIPRKPGTYAFYLNGYDAGTEANDEIINGAGAPGSPGVPADPGGNGGTGASGVIATEHNTVVHVHRGILGDTDGAGGLSDLDSRIHRWLNPVAKVVVTVKRFRGYRD